MGDLVVPRALPSFSIRLQDSSLAGQFTQSELKALKAQFDAADSRGKGMLSAGDLAKALAKLNLKASYDDAVRIVNETDKSRKGGLDFEGFLKAQLSVAGSSEGQSADPTLLRMASRRSLVRSTTTTYAHEIENTEKQAYVDHINSSLNDDPFFSRCLPLRSNDDSLFEAARDGVLLCKLINLAAPGTIDPRAINVKEKLNPWEMNENLSLCLNSAKAIGCKITNIGNQDILDGRPHLILALLSQIIKIQLLSVVDVKRSPELAVLMEEDEEFTDLCGLPAEKLLLRWFNYHLKRGGANVEVTNFGADLKDGLAYTYLLYQLAPEQCDLAPLKLGTPLDRAKAVLQYADRIGARKYLQPHDIVSGQPNLNLAFVANLFHIRSGLHLEVEKMSVAELVPDDDEDMLREERAFRMWLNSLGMDSFVNRLEDLRDGYILLEAIDCVERGAVSWKRVSKPPIKLPFKKVENCNYALDIGRGWRFSLVGIEGLDIVNGNKKFMLAFLWQLMRHSMLAMLKQLRQHARDLADADILQWANEKVAAAARQSRMDSFKDKRLATGQFFLDLLTAVEPRAVDWSVVTSGATEEEKEMNAKYIISVARKLGCSIFLLWDDIVEVRPKMMLTLTAGIMLQSMRRSSKGKG